MYSLRFQRAAQMMDEDDDEETVPPAPRLNHEDTDESGTDASDTTHEDPAVGINGAGVHRAA